MSLDRLHIFKTVYQCGNTADAAALLKVTRPAISQSLSKLEAELGVSLFTRLPKGLTPTPSGHQLAQNIAPLLERIADEVNAVTREREGITGVLHIGAPQTTGTLHMPRIVEMFCRMHPNVEIHLVLENSAILLSRLLKGELDLAIVDVYGGVEFHRDFQSYCMTETLLEEVVVLACSPQFYEDFIGEDLSYENLSGLDFLMMRPEGLELKSWFYHQFGKIPPHFRKRVVVDNGLALIDCARRHLGAMVSGSNVAQEYIERRDLMEILPRIRGEQNKISLVQLLDKKASRLEKSFIRTLKSYAKDNWESGV